MPSATTLEYTDGLVEGLELLWGEGFLAPGGAEEIRCLLEGIEVAGRTILDVGCGLGEPSCVLVEQHGASHVTAVDIEAPVIQKAKERTSARGLAGRIDFQVVSPGTLPFDDESFDIVFSKDAMVHVADKAALFQECYRALRQGGRLVLSDWFCGDRPFSREMEEWLAREAELVTFHFTTLNLTVSALHEIGFEDVEPRDRNDWFRDYVEQELALLAGPLQAVFVAKFGEEEARDWVEGTQLRQVVAEQGHLRPGHVRGRKPTLSRSER